MDDDGGRSRSTLPLDVLFAVVNSTSFTVPELCRLLPTCRGWADIILQSRELWCHLSFRPCQRRLTAEVAERLLSEPRTCSIRTLDLSHCASLVPQTLQMIIRRCGAQLETLEVSHCPAVDDSVLRTIAETCSKLTFLALNHCISDPAVQYVVRRIKALKMLEVSESSLSEDKIRLIEMGHFKVLVLGDSDVPSYL